MQNVRLFFSKTFDARYLSHLDLMRAFTRALKASGLHVWYTEGFNPHIYLQFALPLSLGFESICEIVDVRMVDEIEANIAQRINEYLPFGIEVFDAAPPKQKASEIGFARYIIELADAVPRAANVARSLEKLLAQETLTAQRKNKKGALVDVNIKALIANVSIQTKGEICYIDTIMAAGSERSLNPMLLLEQLFAALDTEPAHILVKRVQILDKTMENFE